MNSRLNFPFAERIRPLGLGGTDIGAILGLSPYKTPLELWSELVSGEQPTSRDLVHLRFGQHAESFIASEYERATGLFIAQHSPTLFHKKHGFMGNRPLEPLALEVEFFPMEEVLHEKVKIH